MTKRIFKYYSDMAKYRVEMKRKLRQIGYHFDNADSTYILELMMKANNLHL